jgi:hypothetical protein
MLEQSPRDSSGCRGENPAKQEFETVNSVRKTITMTALAATLLTLSAVSLAGEAQAQAWNPTQPFDADASQWYPNVEQGQTNPAYQAPQEGQAPPIGDGYSPMGTTPGQMGAPLLPPPSHVPLPLIPPGQEGKAAATAAAAGYLTPPTKYDPTDPGSIDAPQDFYQAPVAVTNINPGGGIQGNAPIQRWGGQTTEDHGRLGFAGSSSTDFGEKLSQKPNLQKMPQFSQDGPRNKASQGQRGSNNRPSNLPGATTSTDLNGNRSSRKDGQRARLTIAPY